LKFTPDSRYTELLKGYFESKCCSKVEHYKH
jgi:hypothetical protein